MGGVSQDGLCTVVRAGGGREISAQSGVLPQMRDSLRVLRVLPRLRKRKKWMEENMPDRFATLSVEDGEKGEDGEKSKRQKRGGKGQVKVKKKETDKAEKKIQLSIAPRGKKKSVTVVQGLRTF